MPACPALTSSRPRAPHVLSINSSVVSGYAGNTLITPALQLLAHTVSSLSTAQFSNHPGYAKKTGEFVPPKILKELWDGLKSNDLHKDIELVLSGYVPGGEEMEVIGGMVQDLRKEKDVFWMLRTVLGDDDRLRVGEGAVDGVRSVLDKADAAVLNAFEAEILSGVTIEDEASLKDCIAALQKEYKTPHIVITSVHLSHPAHSSPPLYIAGSSLSTSGTPQAFLISTTLIEGPFYGAGDLFSALLLHHFQREAQAAGAAATKGWRSEDGVEGEELPLARAVSRAVGKVERVLRGCVAEREGGEGKGEVNPLVCVGGIVGEKEVGSVQKL